MDKYTLIVTEKPEAARRIAQALDYEGNPKKVKEKGVSYYLANRDKKLVVVPARGHLYTVVHERGGRNYYPVFNFKWVPRYLAERGAKKIREWIKVISKLSDGAEEFIDASDYDIEGSVIGYFVLKVACKNKEIIAKRMKFSTLTKMELIKAYEEQPSSLDFGLIEAGKTRHEIDWLYGINLSRALTLSAKRWSGKYTTLSTGRVQGPTLNFLVEREKEIQSFVPTPYWSIKAEAKIMDSIYEVEYEKNRIEKKVEADAIVEACNRKTGEITKVDMKKFRLMPPFPFDLGSLQFEAYSLFGYPPKQTLSITQRLYLEALISYPRTSSQKLPHAINYQDILNKLSKDEKYKNLSRKLLKTEIKPHEGKKKDPAHPAIYPTGYFPERQLNGSEKRIYDLVVRRFMSVFGDPAIKQSVKVSIEINDCLFYLKGIQILKKGWTRFYEPYIRTKELRVPSVKKGEKVLLMRMTREDKFINPPPRYNPISLLKKMEKKGIGTKATRADIIEALYRRGYIAKRRIVVTNLGYDISELLAEFCPAMISVELTRDLEGKMSQIQDKREKSERVLIETVDRLMSVLKKFKQNEKTIGEALSNAIERAKMQERIVGKCPYCGTGNLMIFYSRKTGKRFIGCTNYFKSLCETSFPLPQRGIIKKSGKNCRACGWPTIQIKMKSRRQWMLCFNPNCPLKKEKS